MYPHSKLFSVILPTLDYKKCSQEDILDIDFSKFGYVYRVTNLINSKTYIGRHSPKNNEEWISYMGSGRAIVAAVAKYGKKNFSKELLTYADSLEELKQKENELINQEVSKGKSEYNILISHSEKLNLKSKKELESFPILHWYFEDKLSTHEIAAQIGFSQSIILAYLKESKDSRIGLIKNRTRLEPRRKPPTEKICIRCNNEFSAVKNTQVFCSKKCSNKYKAPPKRTSFNINKAKISASMKNNQNAKGNKGGFISSHKRWHLNRGIISENCYLCQLSTKE